MAIEILSNQVNLEEIGSLISEINKSLESIDEREILKLKGEIIACFEFFQKHSNLLNPDELNEIQTNLRSLYDFCKSGDFNIYSLKNLLIVVKNNFKSVFRRQEIQNKFFETLLNEIIDLIRNPIIGLLDIDEKEIGRLISPFKLNNSFNQLIIQLLIQVRQSFRILKNDDINWWIKS